MEETVQLRVYPGNALLRQRRLIRARAERKPLAVHAAHAVICGAVQVRQAGADNR
jgi:hypothetical protein